MALARLFPVLLALGLLSLLLSRSARAEERWDVVFDLDKVLREQVISDSQWEQIKRVDPQATLIKVGDARFWVYPEVPQLLQSLADDPRIRISFFTAASRFDLDTFLPQLKLPNGKSAQDIAYKTLCGDDLVTLWPDEMTPERGFPRGKYPAPLARYFKGQHKKDINLIPGSSPDRTIFVEDHAPHVQRHQEKNLLYMGWDDIVHRSAKGVGVRRESRSIPPEKRAAYIRGAIARAFEINQRSRKSFPNIFWELQWRKDTFTETGKTKWEWVPSNLRIDDSIYELGRSFFIYGNCRSIEGLDKPAPPH